MAQQPPFALAPSYATSLHPLDEMQFRQWVQQNNVPFDVNATQPQDYDMRGFWRAAQQNNPMAQTAINPNDNMMHYPDYWKTPLHRSFSNESQWAGPNTPQWANESQLADPSGRVVYDEKMPAGILGILNQQ